MDTKMNDEKRLCEICGKPIPPDRLRYWTVKTCCDKHAADLRRRTFRQWKKDQTRIRREKREAKAKEKNDHGNATC
jgi:hypothetical protein